MNERERELVWLRRTRDLSQMLGSEVDPTRLPPRILDAALELTNAERAFLVRVEGPDTQGDYRLEVLGSRGFKGNALSGPEGAVSRTVVERTLTEGRAVITTRDEDAILIHATSVVGRGVRSMVSVPLRSRGHMTGVLYLDHRGEDALFREGDLPTLQTFATQAALSLELAREAKSQSTASAGFVVGSSEAAQTLLEEARRVSCTRDPVLICGEPGTEGALLAREIHALAKGDERAFRRIDCGDPADAVARDLLGHEGEPGVLARLGPTSTVCLDSVERLDPNLQRALARALRSGELVTPGGSQRIPLVARIVALTSVDLAHKVYEGKFEGDLYYRLDVQRLVVPPLRQRLADLPELCDALITRQGGGMAVSPEAIERMRGYAWPGNLLELDSELRKIKARQIRTARPEHFSQAIRDGRGVSHPRQAFSGRTLGELEEEMVRTTMENCKGVKAKAARQLGIPRSTLYHLLERYGIS